MMNKTQFPIVGAFSRNQDPMIDPQDTVNMYVIGANKGMVPTPGLRELTMLPQGTIGRAVFQFRNYIYVVISQYVYRVDASNSYALIGTLATNIGHVGIEANDSAEVIFVDGSKGWLWDTVAGTWSQITASGFPKNPATVDFMDGYFFVNDSETNEWFYSGLNDGTTWNALDFEALESRPDLIVGVVANKRQIYIIGSNATEVWMDTGGALTPFTRNNNMLFEFGCAAKGSIAQGEDVLFWLTSSDNGVGGIVMSDGGAPRRVSTEEVETKIATYTDLYGDAGTSDATGFIYKINGHLFYQLNFTTANASWLYDATTNMWFRLEMENGSRHWAEAHDYFNGKHIVCAYNSSKIYELDPNSDFNGQERIVRKRETARFFDPSMKKIIVDEIDVQVEPGLGTATGTDADPFLELRVSKDGGRTFGKSMREYLGRQGNYQTRCIFKKLGVGQHFIFQFTSCNGIRFVVANASIGYRVVGN